MIDLLILYTLIKGPNSFYGIKKFVDFAFLPFISISYGSIHPALTKLEENGFISVDKKISRGGQRRSSYKINAKGKVKFSELMEKELPQSPQQAKQLSDIKIMLLDEVEQESKAIIIKDIIRFCEIQVINTKVVLENKELPQSQHKHLSQHINAYEEYIKYLNKLQ